MSLEQSDGSQLRRRALTATEIVRRLADLPEWRLSGDGDQVGIERTFTFADYHETISFVNALAFIAHRLDHHPDLSVHYNRCVVRLSTHDVGGISETDIAWAARADALLA
jgi:4a-hydroxytetrahydrobiopterin dehydratase